MFELIDFQLIQDMSYSELIEYSDDININIEELIKWVN